MYADYFHLDRPPFTLTPDPSFLFLSRDHRDALAHLLYGITEPVGFVQLTGEVGTGKTTLCRYLLQEAPPEVNVALVLNPMQTAGELLASVCDELEIDYPEGTRSIKILVDRLNRFLLDGHARGRRTVLVIDEAQNLSPDVLEQIRLLTNLETATVKLLQVLLIGQPELKALMKRPELRQLNQRIVARYHLTTLSQEETRAYVQHRLKVAGCHRSLFTDDALDLIHRFSGGIPRLVNVLCDRGLLGAYARQLTIVDTDMVRTAQKDVDGQSAEPGIRGSRMRGALALGVVLAGIGGGIWFWQSENRVAPRSVPAIGAVLPPGVSTFTTESNTRPDAVTPKPTAILEDIGGRGESRGPMAPNAGAQAENPPAGLDEWLSMPDALSLPENGFSTLMGYWNLDASLLPGPPDCVQSLKAGLQCIQLSGTIKDLLVHNRPAILEIVAADKTVHHLVLAEVRGDRWLLDMAGDRRLFNSEDVRQRWSGRFTLLWRTPSSVQPELVMTIKKE
jgi:general secretion pathway protein A